MVNLIKHVSLMCVEVKSHVLIPHYIYTYTYTYKHYISWDNQMMLLMVKLIFTNTAFYCHLLLSFSQVSVPLGGGIVTVLCQVRLSLCSRGSQDGSHHEGTCSK